MTLHAFVALTVKSASKATVYALVVNDCYNGVMLAQSQTKRFVPGHGCFMLFRGQVSRVPWYFVHWLFGTTSVLLAWFNIFKGLDLYVTSWTVGTQKVWDFFNDTHLK
jgi:hypothetical protein